ncbi:hypothetical protein, partial [Stenotrophomonas maltophilia group sp. RNC7]|uniref:hypothetical protein n=1 Tax=Stenotrophomonas maltophilia group sp. RNC7 TaxID=3071467 RepID=UPI0027E1C28A
IELIGQQFKEFETPTDGTTTITIGGINLKTIGVNVGSSPITLNADSLRILGHGVKDIIIKNEKVDKGISITTTYNQNNSFRIYESIKMNDGDVTIYPNRGQTGSTVNITIKKDKTNYSVFFLKQETDPFMFENMGEDHFYPVVTTDPDGRIRVNVPKNLEPGHTYKVVITNNLNNQPKVPGSNFTNLVTMQKTIGEFYVVDAGVGPVIIKRPSYEGTNAGSYFTIYGNRFEELEITGLSGVYGGSTSLTKDDLSIQTSGDITKLRITYPIDVNSKYNGE